MCTLVILRRPLHKWPVIVATNRDEKIDRPWLEPARHWKNLPGVVAGMDTLAGGTWLGINEHGLIAGIMNRVGTLGPKQGHRSRGELVLHALSNRTAKQACHRIVNEPLRLYRSFNLVLADQDNAFWVRWQQNKLALPGEWERIPYGLSMFTAMERNDLNDQRIRTYLTRFRKAQVPTPQHNDWDAWEKLLLNTRYNQNDGPFGAMKVLPIHGFATLSSSLIALPGRRNVRNAPIWRFVRHFPKPAKFRNIEL